MQLPHAVLIAIAIVAPSFVAAADQKDLFGLVYDSNKYHELCDKGRPSAINDPRKRVYFTNDLYAPGGGDLSTLLTNPVPAKLNGYTDGESM